MKKLALAATALLASMVSVGAQAKVWTYAEVVYAGAGYKGDTFLRLDSINAGDNTYTNRHFGLLPTLKDIGLAIGLAAASSNRQILVESNIDEVDSSTPPTIYGIYLTKRIVTD